MRKIPFGILFLIISVLFSCQQKHDIKQSDLMKGKTAKTDTVVKMENNNIWLLVNLNGGSYFDFHLKEQPINPINFRATKPEERIFMGHFLCFDRWGPPTDAEKANGFQHHGEVNTEVWKLLAEPKTKDGLTVCSMMCSLPMGGLQLTRKIELSEKEPVFFVTEEIKNLNKYGRMFNVVQHVSLAPPFLDTSTLFDNNAEKGFEDKEDGSLNQEEIILKWPEVNHNGEKVSLRQFKNEWPRVSSFVYNQNDKYGWVTACNPEKKLMLGYIWKTEDYPWINFWRSMENGVPMAFGMEFGTTGLHEPFPVVAKKGKIFGRNIYAFIDANEIISKSFTAFLAKIPEDYKGVEKIEITDSLLIIKEKNRVSRDITYHFK
ncbi:MAG: hypothetical protein Q7T72_14030 [Bacteroidales bacterium]|nr:hypothetical protein [Bacteroidales bacterium]